jgi:hypothetical protein
MTPRVLWDPERGMIVLVRPSNNLPKPLGNAGVGNCMSPKVTGQKNTVTSLAGPRTKMSVLVRARNAAGG